MRPEAGLQGRGGPETLTGERTSACSPCQCGIPASSVEEDSTSTLGLRVLVPVTAHSGTLTSTKGTPLDVGATVGRIRRATASFRARSLGGPSWISIFD